MHRVPHRLAYLCVAASLLLISCGGGSNTGGTQNPPPPPPPPPPVVRTALNDLGAGNYMGFTGGLYPNGSNSVPGAHNIAGLARANAIQPLDTNGNPSPAGRIVMLSIGMSNTTQEFCSSNSLTPCNNWTFMGQAAADPAVNTTTLTIINGARGGQTASTWDSPTDPNYDEIRTQRLQPAGLDERQVQIVWVKVANAQPGVAIPSAQSDAATLVAQMGNIARALKVRYPSVQLVFFSSRIYAGYATTTLNPEPYAYESGFAVKWVVQAQIDQMAAGGAIVDARAGDLNYATGIAPWVAWGPYLWANGTMARIDGLLWIQADFENDGTHPAMSGEQKVGTQLLSFSKNSAYTKCWFINGGTCP